MADTHGSSSCHQGHLTPGEVYPVRVRVRVRGIVLKGRERVGVKSSY